MGSLRCQQCSRLRLRNAGITRGSVPGEGGQGELREGELGIKEAHTQTVLRGHRRGSLWEPRTKSSSRHLHFHFRGVPELQGGASFSRPGILTGLGIVFQQLFPVEEENEECFQEATSLLEYTRTATVALALCSQQNSNLRLTGQLPPRQDGHRKHTVLSPAECFFCFCLKFLCYMYLSVSEHVEAQLPGLVPPPST